MPTLPIRDTQLYYESAGAGQPILFIHGLGSSTRDWQLQLDHFSSRYHMVTMDVRGHGRSAKPPGPYSVPQFAADVIALIHTLELERPHIVGISMGGMIALQIAIDAPDLPRSLTVVNSPAELVFESLKDHFVLAQRKLIVQLLGMRRMGEFLARRLFLKPEEEEIRRIFAERWAENDKRAYLDALDGLVGWSVTGRVGEIQCPVLVVAADHDYTPVSAKAAYVAQIPQAELVVMPDSRHATPVEHPQAFNRVLAEFLAKVENAR